MHTGAILWTPSQTAVGETWFKLLSNWKFVFLFLKPFMYSIILTFRISKLVKSSDIKSLILFTLINKGFYVAYLLHADCEPVHRCPFVVVRLLFLIYPLTVVSLHLWGLQKIGNRSLRNRGTMAIVRLATMMRFGVLGVKTDFPLFPVQVRTPILHQRQNYQKVEYNSNTLRTFLL